MNAMLVDLKAKNNELELKLFKLAASGDKAEAENKDEAVKEEVELRRLDREDVDKPDKYGGDADHWLKWSKSFKKSLERQDVLRPAILEAVEARPWAPLGLGNPSSGG